MEVNDKFQEDLFDLAQYIVASAEGLKNEPKDYGPLRLIEVLRRLGLLMEKSCDDEFMGGVANEIEQNKDLVMKDKKQFYEFLNQLVIKFTREAEERL